MRRMTWPIGATTQGVIAWIFCLGSFDTQGFPARWHCGAGWQESPWLGWLHIVSDLGVWSAYLAIPVVLWYFILRRKDLPFRKVFLLFGAFIFACGTTHLMEAIIFWWPGYRLAGVIKLFTALVSWATVIALIRVVPGVLKMRAPDELEREIAAQSGRSGTAKVECRLGAAGLRAHDRSHHGYCGDEGKRAAREATRG